MSQDKPFFWLINPLLVNDAFTQNYLHTQYGSCVQQYNQHNSGFGACSPEYIQLQSECEKQRALNEQQAQENNYLRGLVDSLLKKQN